MRPGQQRSLSLDPVEKGGVEAEGIEPSGIIGSLPRPRVDKASGLGHSLVSPACTANDIHPHGFGRESQGRGKPRPLLFVAGRPITSRLKRMQKSD